MVQENGPLPPCRRNSPKLAARAPDTIGSCVQMYTTKASFENGHTHSLVFREVYIGFSHKLWHSFIGFSHYRRGWIALFEITKIHFLFRDNMVWKAVEYFLTLAKIAQPPKKIRFEITGGLPWEARSFVKGDCFRLSSSGLTFGLWTTQYSCL